MQPDGNRLAAADPLGAPGPAAPGEAAQPGRPDPERVGSWVQLAYALVLGLGLFLATSLGLAIGLELLGQLPAPGQPPGIGATLALYFGHFVSFAGTAWWLGARRERLGWRGFGLRPFALGWLAAGLLAAFLLLPVRLLAALLVDWLLGGGLAGMEARMDLMVPAGPPLLTAAITLAGAGLLAPLAEELFFRGLIHRWFWAHWPGRPVLRVVVSSVIFALGHFDTPAVVAASFFLGAVCAVAYERSRSLWVPAAIHAVNNSLAVILLYAAVALGAALGIS